MKKSKIIVLISAIILLLLFNFTSYSFTSESFINLMNNYESARTSFNSATLVVEGKTREERIEEERKRKEAEERERIAQEEKRQLQLKKEQEEKAKRSVINKTNTNKVEVKEDKVEPKEEIKQVVHDNRIMVSSINSKLMKDQNGDNFYLNHNINGVEDGIGVPYIDFRTDFSERKVIIYAHSSKSVKGPFQDLQNYHNNKNYYNNHKYITINYEGKTYKYLIFSVYVAVADDRNSEELEYFYKLKYTEAGWDKAIKELKAKSEYDTGVAVSSSDRIVILQTCSMDPEYYHKHYRANLLVIGKLV